MKLSAKDIEIAEATTFLRSGCWYRDPKVNLAGVLHDIAAQGFKIRPKRRLSIAADMTTTYTPLRQIRTAYRFSERPVSRRAVTLGHELVHVRQRVRMFSYLDPHYRFRTEVPAYRETLRIERAQGASLEQLEKRIDAIIDSLRRRYFVGVAHPEHVGGEVSRILHIDLAEWAKVAADLAAKKGPVRDGAS